jgi:hypothetical protein
MAGMANPDRRPAHSALRTSHSCDERRCERCGNTVTNPLVARCPRCWAALPAMACGSCRGCPMAQERGS